MKRRPPRRRPLRFDPLEARQLLAVGDDFFELKNDSLQYRDDFFLAALAPVMPTADTAGRRLFDFRVNHAGDQTADLLFAVGDERETRILVDPSKAYQLALATNRGDSVLVIESFDQAGNSLGQSSVPLEMAPTAGLNFFNRAEAHATLGPGGVELPADTAWIELVHRLSSVVRFGFVEDYAFSFQSERSVDEHTSTVRLPINPGLSYTISAKAIDHSGTAVPAQLHSLGYIALDGDGLVIEPIHTQKYGNSVDARLASPLSPGDTTIVLTTTAGWSNESLDPNTRALAWFGYQDRQGNSYADFTYTRTVALDAANGMWSQHGIVGNTIVLNKPWAGPALPLGTAMRNAVNDDALVPALLERSPLASSTTATLHGAWSDGTPVAGKFAPGTRSIQLAAITNQSSVEQDQLVSVRMQFSQSEHVSIVSPVTHARVVTLDVLANDGDGQRQIVSVTNGARGSVQIAPGGQRLVYHTQDYFLGTDAFSYESVDGAGSRETYQVQIRSLGGNVDADPAFQAAFEAAAANSAKFYPTLGLNHNLVGVKDQTLSSTTQIASPVQLQAHRLEHLPFQAGSLSFYANGDFDYQPAPGQTSVFPFTTVITNGSDSQSWTSFIEIAENEFRRDQARLQDLGRAVVFLESVYKRLFFPGGLPLDASGRPFLSWRVHMLPFLGYTELYDRFKQDEPWNSAHNLPLLAEMPELFRSAGDGPGVTSTRYQALASSSYPSPLQLLLNNADGKGDLKSVRNITDGEQNTLLVVQAGADKAVPWTKNTDLPFDGSSIAATLGDVGDYFNAYFWDFNVDALPTNMSMQTFQGLATPNSGDFADPAAIFREQQDRSDYPGDGDRLNAISQEKQMKNLAGSLLTSESVFKRFVPPAAGATTPFSWRVWILPYIGQQGLFAQFKLNETWDSPHNLSVAARMPDIFRSLGDAADSTTTRFRVLGGSHMAYGHSNALLQGPRMSDFTDGLANSILIVEAGTDRAVPWTMPEVLPIDPANFWASLGNLPEGNLLLGMADGSVTRAARSTPNELMMGIATINQGDSNRTAFHAVQPERQAVDYIDLTNQLKQVALASHYFESAYRRLPNNFVGSPTTLPGSANVGLSWRVAILPFIEEHALYEQFRLDEPWDSPHNLSLLPLMPDIFRTGREKPGDYTTRIQRFSGPDTIDPMQKITFRQITDGTSNTLLAGIVAPEKAVPWTKPEDIDFPRGSDWPAVGNINFMHAAAADGSVFGMFFHPELRTPSVVGNFAYGTFEQLVSRNDGGFGALWQQTLVISEGVPLALNLTSDRQLLLELEDPTVADAAAKPDGYLANYGSQQRITIEGRSDRNGPRQTRLFVKARINNDPTMPYVIIQTIDLIIVDKDLPPGLDPINDITLSEDAGTSKIEITGLTPGRNERQALSLAARSLNPDLVTVEAVEYELGSTKGNVFLTPSTMHSGIAVVEITVSDAGADGDLTTTADNAVTQRLFTITVEARNDAPVIAPLNPVNLPEDSGSQTTFITGIHAGPGETQPLRVTASTNSLLLALTSTNLVLSGSTASLRWTPLPDRFGQAIVLVQVEDGGLDKDLATSADNATTVSSLTINLTGRNDAPEIERPSNQLAVEDTPELVVSLPYLSAGPYETESDLRIFASAGNLQLIEEVSIQHTPGTTEGSLIIKPRVNQAGSTVVTVRVEDGGADNDLATTGDNLVTETAFEVVIQAVNDAPTLGSIDNILVDINTSDLSVALVGITSGDEETQPLRITATTEASSLIAAPQVEYVSGSTAMLKLTTLGSPGQGTVRVLVEDGGLDGNLATAGDNLSTVRHFVVTVNVPPIATDDRFRVIKNNSSSLNVLDNDLDVADSLTVVIMTPPATDQGTVQVNSDNTIQFVPAPDFIGSTVFEYQVVDQHGRASATASVTIGVSQSRYQNPFDSTDVNADGQTTALDALLIINTLNDPTHPKNEAGYNGSEDLDTSGDGSFTAIDALLVINKLNTQTR